MKRREGAKAFLKASEFNAITESKRKEDLLQELYQEILCEASSLLCIVEDYRMIAKIDWESFTKEEGSVLVDAIRDSLSLIWMQYEIYAKVLKQAIRFSYDNIDKPYVEATSFKKYTFGERQLVYFGTVWQSLMDTDRNVKEIVVTFEDLVKNTKGGSPSQTKVCEADLLETYLQCVFLCSGLEIWDIQEEQEELRAISIEIMGHMRGHTRKEEKEFLRDVNKPFDKIRKENASIMQPLKEIQRRSSCEMSIIQKDEGAIGYQPLGSFSAVMNERWARKLLESLRKLDRRREVAKGIREKILSYREARSSQESSQRSVECE